MGSVTVTLIPHDFGSHKFFLFYFIFSSLFPFHAITNFLTKYYFYIDFYSMYVLIILYIMLFYKHNKVRY